MWKSGAPDVTGRKIVSSLCIRFRICARVHPEVRICICFAGNIGRRQKPGCNWSGRAGRACGRCGCGRTSSSGGSSSRVRPTTQVYIGCIVYCRSGFWLGLGSIVWRSHSSAYADVDAPGLVVWCCSVCLAFTFTR